jgi:hypothetical protein
MKNKEIKKEKREQENNDILTFNNKYASKHEPTIETPIENDSVERTEEGYPIIESIN